jgi:Kef-type K+ transport system membrane component KefB
VPPIALFLFQASLLIAGPWALWRLTGIRRIAPLAVLQICAGVLLGPSVLGVIAPTAQAALFPTDSVPKIASVAQLAVVLYSFCAGMHLDHREVARAQGTATIAATSFALPMLAGAVMAVLLADAVPAIMPEGMTSPSISFIAALALLTTVTALPVLAALMRETGILHTPFGQRALGLAAINDAGMWIGVAAILLVVAPEAEGAHLMAMPPLILLIAGVSQVLRRLTVSDESSGLQVLLCAYATLAAALSEAAGVGYVIGAFVAGVTVPYRYRKALLDRLEWPALFILMPFFFMATGLRIREDLLSPQLIGLVVVLSLTAMSRDRKSVV